MRQTKVVAKYLVIDTETSGLHSWKNGLVQMAALVLDRELEVVAEYNQFICPPKDTEYDEEAAKIHNIPQSKIDGGLSYESFCRDFILFIRKHFPGSKPILVGQFFPFDYGFLDFVFMSVLDGNILIKDEEREQYGVFQGLLGRNFIDTKSMANILNLKAELENRPPLFQITSLSSLGGLKDTLAIPPEKFQAHDALGDCYATREVMEKMFQLFKLV